MGLLEKYYKYKQGELVHGDSKEMLRFFKTKPTDEQIMLLEGHNKKEMILTFLALCIYLLLGIIIGLLWSLLWLI